MWSEYFVNSTTFFFPLRLKNYFTGRRTVNMLAFSLPTPPPNRPPWADATESNHQTTQETSNKLAKRHHKHTKRTSNKLKSPFKVLYLLQNPSQINRYYIFTVTLSNVTGQTSSFFKRQIPALSLFFLFYCPFSLSFSFFLFLSLSFRVHRAEFSLNLKRLQKIE